MVINLINKKYHNTGLQVLYETGSSFLRIKLYFFDYS